MRRESLNNFQRNMDNLQITCRNLKVKQKQVKIIPVQSTDFTIKSAQRTGKTGTGSCADSQESHPVFPSVSSKGFRRRWGVIPRTAGLRNRYVRNYNIKEEVFPC